MLSQSKLTKYFNGRDETLEPSIKDVHKPWGRGPKVYCRQGGRFTNCVCTHFQDVFLRNFTTWWKSEQIFVKNWEKNCELTKIELMNLWGADQLKVYVFLEGGSQIVRLLTRGREGQKMLKNMRTSFIDVPFFWFSIFT